MIIPHARVGLGSAPRASTVLTAVPCSRGHRFIRIFAICLPRCWSSNSQKSLQGSSSGPVENSHQSLQQRGSIGEILVNGYSVTAGGWTTVRNMKKGAKVALSIMDPGNPDRYVQLRGTVRHIRQDDVATTHIDRLAFIYLGLDKNPYAKAGDIRAMFDITPYSIEGMS